MDALITGGHHRANSEKTSSFRGPVAAGTSPVLVPRKNHERHLLLRVTHGCVVDRHLLPIGMVNRDAAFYSRDHEIFDPDIRKSSASHDKVVSAPAAVTIEIGRLNPARF